MSPSPWDHPWEHFTTVTAPPQHPALCPFPALPPQHFFTNLLNILLFPLSPSRMGTLWGQGFCLFLVFMRLWLAIYHLSISIHLYLSIYHPSIYHLSSICHWSIIIYQPSIIDLSSIIYINHLSSIYFSSIIYPSISMNHLSSCLYLSSLSLSINWSIDLSSTYHPSIIYKNIFYCYIPNSQD